MFEFIFAMTNPSAIAQGAALRIANHILKNIDDPPDLNRG